ncbi:hypothetical protein [Caulobacter sp. NIBR1757]|uniref:CC_3452 family protein n=1 Tax=Caulobacter sp. NIBR1757 TaxID=3016000 RepID=UPI0022F103F8|nr:hypothetical protein [Caulobacter sp. NIBR1757]WGM39852.1 hypothetical protein AMEJIAPC_02792 [Caulobacter sp. NIBR1757]
MRVFLIGALALTACAGAANAADAQRIDGWLTLKTKTTRGNVIVDGAVWSCKGDVCRAPKVKALPADQQCRKLKGELGEVTGFGYRGAKFSLDELAACNA